MRPVPIARVFGIPIVVDLSWTVIALLVTGVLYAELVSADDDVQAAVAAGLAVAGAALFFCCLLAHELSHSVVAIRRGMRVRRIRLFIFGGVSEIEQEAGTPGDELVITLAGPAMSLALAAAFVGLAVAVPSSAGAADRLLEVLALVNLALGVFNLAPGFPLDGGRVLRAVLWRRTGSFRWATTVAVNVGRAIAGLLAAAGIAVVVLGRSIEGLWWIAIGWFLFRAAGASLTHVRMEEALHGVAVADVMSCPPPVVDGGSALDRVLAEHDRRGRRLAVLVVVRGRVLGVIDREAVRNVPRDRWSDVTAAAAMRHIGPRDLVEADAPATEAMGRVAGARRPLIAVRSGRVVGALAPADLVERVRTRGVV